MKIIDAHCHLDFDAFDADRDEVLARAAKAGVEHIILPGVDVDNWDRIRALCEGNPMLSACYGLHPYFIDRHQPAHLAQLKNFAAKHDCVAIGECGLDFRDNMAPRELQQEYFQSQLDIAGELDKPVVIHAVRATQQVIDTLKHHPGLRGMVHSYSGSYEQALQLIDMDFYISFGGAITYKQASRVRDCASRLPLSSLLIETDAPDQPDDRYRGERNHPAYISYVLRCLAELRDEHIDTVAEHLYENTKRLFALDH